MLRSFKPGSSDWAAPLDHADQDDYDRQHEEQVNEAPQRVRTHHTESPQYEQNYRDCPEHCETRFLGRFLAAEVDLTNVQNLYVELGV
jgi:hypothetical protein